MIAKLIENHHNSCYSGFPLVFKSCFHQSQQIKSSPMALIRSLRLMNHLFEINKPSEKITSSKEKEVDNPLLQM